jgi:hypothetical protein
MLGQQKLSTPADVIRVAAHGDGPAHRSSMVQAVM